MRIAMLSWESLHSVAAGGVATHVTELAAALARDGHDVHIFTRIAPGQAEYDKHFGVHYHRCPYPGHHNLVDDANNMCRAFVDRLFAAEEDFGCFDVVHAHDWLAANAMIWIKQGRGRFSVFTVHSTEYARCGNSFPPGDSHRIREQERAGCYWADHVIAVSETTRQEAMWMYETPDWKSTVVFNGVAAHRFAIPVDEEQVRRRYAIGPLDPVVLFCGRLEWQKGPDLLIETLPGVLAAHPRTKFLFLGDGSLRTHVERRAHEMGCGDAIRMAGRQKDEEVVRLFRIADLVAVPSRNEPFGLVVLEAWSAGKPVVATHCGGPGEYVWHEVTGLKVYPDPNSICWGLVTTFNDFNRARWMGARGREAVRRQFSWERVASETLAVYTTHHPDFKPIELEPAPAIDTTAPAPGAAGGEQLGAERVDAEPAHAAPTRKAQPAAQPTVEPPAAPASPAESEADAEVVARAGDVVHAIADADVEAHADPEADADADADAAPDAAPDTPADAHADDEPAPTGDADAEAAEPSAEPVYATIELRLGDGQPLGDGQRDAPALDACERALRAAGCAPLREGASFALRDRIGLVFDAVRACRRALADVAGVELECRLWSRRPDHAPAGDGHDDGASRLIDLPARRDAAAQSTPRPPRKPAPAAQRLPRRPRKRPAGQQPTATAHKTADSAPDADPDHAHDPGPDPGPAADLKPVVNPPDGTRANNPSTPAR